MIQFLIPPWYRTQLDLTRLEEAASITLEALDLPADTTLSLKITNNRAIAGLNLTYRGLDEPTDVLSFENEYIDPETGTPYLGEIVISFEKARSQAREHAANVQTEIEMLLVHGILHLGGLDHLTKSQYRKMSEQQDEILLKLGNPLLGSIYEIH